MIAYIYSKHKQGKRGGGLRFPIRFPIPYVIRDWPLMRERAMHSPYRIPANAYPYP
jgi:hypothetical protein